MSTLVTARPRPARTTRRPKSRPAEARQESLFGALPAAPARPEPATVEPEAPARREPATDAPARETEAPVTAAPPTPEPVEIEAVAPSASPAPRAGAETADLDATTARAHRQGPTLEDLVAGAWEGLLAGAPAACPVCETTLSPRYSAGAGIVGGRCGGCGSTLG